MGGCVGPSLDVLIEYASGSLPWRRQETTMEQIMAKRSAFGCCSALRTNRILTLLESKIAFRMILL